MSEVTDLIMPDLCKMQSDLAEVRGDVTEVRGDVRGIAERMDAFDGYFTYTMGLTARDTADIEAVREDMKEMRRQFMSADPI
jgi:hypothetical protein